ncbi:hypothetical protein [Bdellovibrio bacteriovorus]|uniref:hypothetical protein n=1 Tax=Bdellovibrio bacteriovorus TaxID=959 RepID=UPI001E5F125B|nr:hypothetical protein [Bdellovibrio bacteriovorus]
MTGAFWADAAQSQKLFNGSEVFTGASSEALLEMRNKDLLHVPADTLLRISEDIKTGALALNLDKGSVQVEGKGQGQPLSLRVGNSDVKLKSESPFGVYAKKDLSGNVTLSMSSGTVSLESGDQKKALSVGEALQISDPSAANKGVKSEQPGAATGTQGAGGAMPGTSYGGSGEVNVAAESSPATASALQMTALPRENLILLEPESKRVFYGDGLDFFKWKSTDDKKVKLQISRSADFLTETRTEDVSGKAEAVIPKSMNAGEYFWRLVDESTDVPNFSESRTFTIENLGGVALGPPVLKLKERGKWTLTVPVQGSKPGEDYHLQVGKSKGFNEIYDEYEGTEPLRSFIDTSGEYNIRVRRYFGNMKYSEWSDAAKVIVRPPLSAPFLSKSDEKINSSGLSEMTLTWNAVPNAVDYVVQMADGPKFSNVLKNVIVEKGPYVFKHNESVPGYLRLLARSADGEYSPSSDVYRIKGVIRGPAFDKKEVLPPEMGKAGATPQFHLLWAHRSSAKGYRIELSRDAKLAGAQVLETDHIEFLHPVNEEGWYYFRVSPIVDESRYFSVPTPILAVSYGKPGPLITPTISSPKKSEVFLIPRGVPVSIKFRWSESPENEWYVLEMSQNPDFSGSTVLKVTGQEYILKKAIKNGQWYFRVKGRNKYQESAWSDTGVFYFGVSQ